jgi:uncharacterized protein YecE (DUF72 family)
MRGRLRLGTSGYVYPHWQGVFNNDGGGAAVRNARRLRELLV